MDSFNSFVDKVILVEDLIPPISLIFQPQELFNIHFFFNIRTPIFPHISVEFVVVFTSTGRIQIGKKSDLYRLDRRTFGCKSSLSQTPPLQVRAVAQLPTAGETVSIPVGECLTQQI